MARTSLMHSLLCVLSTLALPVGALGQVRLGIEFQVNTYTRNSQLYPSVATTADGGFVVVWQSETQDDGVFRGVFAQRFSSGGVPLAGEFQVNSYTPGNQVSPAVAVGAGGAFMVAWHGTDGSAAGVFARLFSSAGVPLDHDFQVNTYTYNWQSGPAVAAVADGSFIVVWSSGSLVGDMQDGSDTGVFARLLSSTGTPLMTEFQVNSRTQRSQEHPSVAADAAGNFVVVWESYQQDGSRDSVFAKRFSSTGHPIASEFQVNAHTRGCQRFPALGGARSVAVDADGDFVIAWESLREYIGQGGLIRFRDVSARRFSSAGAPLANEFQVHTYTTGDQRLPSVAADAGGAFVITWWDGSVGRNFARLFSSAGAPLVHDFQVNIHTWGTEPTMAVGANDEFVIVWRTIHDGSGSGVFAQLFAPGVTAPLPTETPTATVPPLTATATVTPTRTSTPTVTPAELNDIPTLSGNAMAVLALLLLTASLAFLLSRQTGQR